MRVFTLALGLGAGLLVGAAFVRRLDEAQRAVQPTSVAGAAGRAAAGMTTRLRQAIDDGRLAAAEREAELRGRFDVPGIRDAVGR